MQSDSSNYILVINKVLPALGEPSDQPAPSIDKDFFVPCLMFHHPRRKVPFSVKVQEPVHPEHANDVVF